MIDTTWKQYSFEDGTPYNGTECPEGYYGCVATKTLKKHDARDEVTVFRFRVRFKSTPTPQKLKAHKDLDTLIEAAQLSNEKPVHDFIGNYEKADAVFDKYTALGYDIQDIYNLGKYEETN